VAIVIPVLVALALLALSDALPWRTAVALLGGGLAVAVAGWADDVRDASPATRAAVHLAAAVWTVAWLGGLDAVRIGSTSIELGAVGHVAAILGIVWCTNLYNFMDGIDGIAAGEAVIVAVAGGALLLATGEVGLGLLVFALGGASLGFLRWNWPPARIFMGDVGSGFIGYLFAAIALTSEANGSLPLLAWIVLLGAFVVDSTLTLLRRAARGHAVYRAHALHAYQRMARWLGSHRPVTIAVIAIDILLAGAVAVTTRTPQNLTVAAAMSFAGLIAAYAWVERFSPMWKGDIPTAAGGGR
jgi:Fuc2NAc and GlcNAc transferase